MEQGVLLPNLSPKEKKIFDLGSGLVLKMNEGEEYRVTLYRHGQYIKTVDLSDRVAKRLFVVETVEMGAMPSRLASTLSMSRQTIHNYLEIKKHFGTEGVVQGYNLSESKSLRKQREIHSEKRLRGNKAKQVAQIRKEVRDQQEQRQREFNFSYGEKEAKIVPRAEQPFCEEHGWEATRYAGVFVYIITLISEWRWLQLVMGYFGSAYKIFMVFILMVSRNIRSIEQLKNVISREAGRIIGIDHLPCKPKIWEWFYNAVHERVSHLLLMDYFRYQIRVGLVGIWLWFTDGHLLPYTGRANVRWSYNTQRRMPVPGQTNLVTCDGSGRVVDFEIQEGKGDLRGQIIALGQKWKGDVPEGPVMVFDREGHGSGFFWELVLNDIAFVTWEKNIDSTLLASLGEEMYQEEIEFNGKKYNLFEENKSFTYTPEESDAIKHNFTLRRIHIWNRTSNRRTCGLAWTGDRQMSTADCACAILNRWGSSENTFKHIKERHPLHYHPGFELVESDLQEINNPAIKERQSLINKTKKGLSKLYEKLSKAKESIKKDGTSRKNSVRENLKNSIEEQEASLKRLQEEKRQLPEKVDVSSLEDYKSFKRLDNEGKNLFDFVTTSVWNARKQMVDWLRPVFNQENELIDLFYAITDCHGWIKSGSKEVIVRLEPLQQPKRRLAQEQLCRRLTGLGARTPTGKWLIIEVGECPR